MYRYYQTSREKGWEHLRDSADVEDQTRKLGAKFLSVLAVDTVINDEVDNPHDRQYRGPFYIDIDCKNDLQQAIDSAKEICNKLIDNYGVHEDHIYAWASGSKGVHLIVPESTFSSGRAVKWLPLIYREMAKALWEPGLDFQVYSQGRGNSWRLDNVQREDGNYRVPLTLAELKQLTAETYHDMVKAPKVLVRDKPSGVKYPKLEHLFKECVDIVKKDRNRINVVNPVPDKKLIEYFKDEVPQCITDLCDNRKRGDASFNALAMQLSIFVVRSTLKPSTKDLLVNKFALKASSSQYDSEVKRRKHVSGMISYVASAKDGYKFSCAAMRAQLSTKPCEGCPLEEDRKAEADEDLTYMSGIKATVRGYFELSKDGEPSRRITNFVMEPMEQVLEVPKGEMLPIRTGLRAAIMLNGERRNVLTIEESAWGGRSSLISALQGVGNAIFEGSDADVQRLKELIFSQENEMGEVVRKYSAGIHIDTVSGAPLRVYVEPGYSINELGVKGTHFIDGSIPAAPVVKDVRAPEPGEESVEKAMVALMTMLTRDAAAPIVGWFSSAHLKAHIMARTSQFPLLNLTGDAGSGKSTVATLMGWLAGVDYTGANAPINAPAATDWSVIHYLSSTTTVPRILEEVNKAKMGEKRFNFVTEMLKGVWNSQNVPRGTINRGAGTTRGRTGAVVVEIPLSGPTVFCNEQAIDIPALQQRSICVLLSRHVMRRGQDMEVTAQRYEIRRFARALTSEALKMTEDQVFALYDATDEVVPQTLDFRPRHAYRCVLTGLKFLEQVGRKLRMPKVAQTAEELIEQQIILCEEMSALSVSGNHRSEMDIFMEKVCTMISMSAMGTMELVSPKNQFYIDNDFLYLELQTMHSAYLRYCRTVEGVTPIFANSRQLSMLIEQAPYFEQSRAMHEEMWGGKPVLIQLSIPRMMEKKLPVHLLLQAA